MNTLLKTYIHSVDLNENLRPDLVFSDPDKIRMYTDNVRLGVRLHGVYYKPAQRIKFPADEDGITVRLPEWAPQAVKSWDGFQETSSKPDGTTIEWRVSDGTSDYWWDGGAWSVVTPLVAEWNTEIEISANLSTFPWTQKKIQFVAKLKTTDRWETPVLLGTRLLMTASFDWFEDLISESIVPRLRQDFTVLVDWVGQLETETDRFNITTDHNFTPDQNWNVTDIDAIYDYDNDPNQETDLLQSFDVGTGLVRLAGTKPAGTNLFYHLVLEPEIAINFPNVDYNEIGKTPTVIIDRVDIEGRQVKATIDMALKDREEGRKLDSPLWVREMKLQCSIITGEITTAFRSLTNAYAFVVRGATQITGHPIGPILTTKALDLKHTLKMIAVSKYNPKPNFSDLKENTFQLTIRDFYAWLRDIENRPYVKNFNYQISDMRDTGTGNPDLGPTPLPGGAMPGVYKFPEVEEA